MPLSGSSKPFPRYLVPSFPFTFFRRRRSSTSSTSSSSSSAPPSPTSHQTLLRCLSCGLDLCLSSQIISKGFTGRHGRAYLVRPSPVSTTSPSPSSSLPNTYAGPAMPRQLVTGAHTVSDLACVGCRSVLGWRYVAAEEESQRYKVGMCILETRRVCGGVWSGEELDTMGEEWVDDDEEGVEFDSQDEDECEDLFAGLWSAKTAAARRRRREKRGGGGD